MPILRSARRAAAVLGIAVLATLGVPALTSGATPLARDSTTGTTIPILPTTTTIPTPATTTPTTTPPATTPPTTAPPPGAPPTTASPKATTTTSTTVKSPPVTGVPSVPVGGPPTTKPTPGKPPPPPPNPAPILTAVDTELSQLGAINEYKAAKAAVADGEDGVVTAGALVQSAEAGVASANHAQSIAQAAVGRAAGRLRALALAAYMGIGYATTQSGSTGSSTTLGDLTGSSAVDAQVMLQLVAQHVRAELASSHRQLSAKQHDTGLAEQAVMQARKDVTVAQETLASAQRNLDLVVRAATVPGAAAGLDLLASAEHSPTAGPLLAASSTAAPKPTSPPILGPSILNGSDLAGWFKSTSHKANVTVPIAQLAADYQAAGKATGVRYDVAFAQSIVETGFFSFPSYGQLTPKYNNFAGIGACDTCAHGWKFPNAKTGVSAQLELLEAYASTKPVPTPLIGPVGVGGCCPTWIALAGKWASSLQYGISIMTVYQQMLAWVIPQRLLQAGLIAPKPAPAAKGPSLAPLPASAGA